MLVKDVMRTELFFFEEEQIISVSDILGLEKVRNIPVVNKNKKLVGIITHREFMKALSKRSEDIPVKNYMVTEVVAVGPEIPLKGAIDIMIINKFGCLPVVSKERKLIGLLTETDLLQMLFKMVKLPDAFFPSVKLANLSQ